MLKFFPGDRVILDVTKLTALNLQHPEVIRIMKSGGTIKRGVGDWASAYFLEEVPELAGNWPEKWLLPAPPIVPPKICGSIYG